MKQLSVVILLALLHTLPLWNLNENLAGGYGDPFTHATIGDWYCNNVLTGNFHYSGYLSPYGVDVSGSYDSPFPFILTCPAVAAGPLFQFHLFTLLQILLIVYSAWLVAKQFLKSNGLQFCYIFFVWWCGFYISRSHQHETLLSQIWGLQFVFYAIATLIPRNTKSVLISSLLIALALTGTFHNIATLLFIAVILTLFKLWQMRNDLAFGKTYLNLFLGLLLSTLIFGGLWWPMIAFTLKNGTIDVSLQRQLFNLDLLSPLVPFESNLIYKWLQMNSVLSYERYNSFDPVILAVVIFSLFKRDFWREKLRLIIFTLGMFYFVLSLGPELRIKNEIISALSFNAEFLNYFPFKVSRTPARFAAVTNLSFILLAFLFLDQHLTNRYKKHIAYFLLLWIFVTGPIMNQMLLFPTINFRSVIPTKGLESLKNLPADSIVVSIPSAWAQDPTENFNRLFHQKSISSAYLSYTAYNKTLREQFVMDPFLGRMGCEDEVTAFHSTPLLGSFDALRAHLKERRLHGLVINKLILLSRPECQNLKNWTVELLKNPWVKVTQENSNFVTAEIQ